MLNYLKSRMLNVGLRGMTMGSRFILLIVLAKLLEPAEIGLFGLFTATIGFSVLVIGGDYYTYSQRELMSHPQERWSFVLQHQMIATGLLYIILLPAQLLFFWFELLPRELLVWFFILLVLEHIAQEMNRLLVAMQRPVIASWVLFFRVGAWVWIALPVIWFVPNMQNLYTIFFAWLIGVIIAIIMGILVIYQQVAPWQRWSLDYTWLKRGFKVGFLFLFATMCFRALLIADRYVVEHLAGAESLGVYVFYVGIAMNVVNFLDPSVFSFLYPRVVMAYRQGNYPLYQKSMRELAWSSIVIGLLLVIALVILTPIVLSWIGRDIYLSHLPVFWWLLAVAFIYALGMIPHYGLYARGADRVLVFAHFSSLAIFAITVIILATHTPFMAAVYGLLTALTWMGLVKLIVYLKLTHREQVADFGYLAPKGTA